MASPSHARVPLSVALARQRSRVDELFRARRSGNRRRNAINEGDIKHATTTRRGLGGLIATSILAGCGGSSSSSSTSGETLSKSEFLAQGNAICAKGGEEIQAAGKKVFTSSKAPSQATQEKFATDTIIPNVQQQIDGIEALTPPSGDESQVKAITDAAQSALDKVKSDPTLLTDQGNGADPFAQANKLADAYGLDKCGSGSG